MIEEIIIEQKTLEKSLFSLFYIIRKHYSKTTLYTVWIYFLVRYFIRIPFKPSYWILFKNILYFTPKSNSIRNN